MNTRVLIFNFRTDTVLSDVDLAIKEYYEKFDDNKIRRIKVDCEKNVFTITINILACLDDNNEEGLLSGDSVVLTELGKERIRSVVSDDYCLDNVFTILELKPRNSFIIKDHFGLKFEVIGVDIQKK
jgi:hypothetical protein